MNELQGAFRIQSENPSHENQGAFSAPSASASLSANRMTKGLLLSQLTTQTQKFCQSLLAYDGVILVVDHLLRLQQDTVFIETCILVKVP